MPRLNKPNFEVAGILKKAFDDAGLDMEEAKNLFTKHFPVNANAIQGNNRENWLNASLVWMGFKGGLILGKQLAESEFP